jgi:cold shock CspA family protein
MARSEQSFSKKEKEKKRLKKRELKMKKKEERKANSKGGGLENMIAYVDAYGNLTDTPPDPAERELIDADSIEIGIPKKVEEEYDPVHNGTVAFFNSSKGFGFINDSNSGEKYFVHTSGLIDAIAENDKVSFELEKGMKGMNAVKVKKI